MNGKLILSLVVPLFISSLCGCDRKECEIKKAYVYETRFYHWGRGYYRLNVLYEFRYRGDTVRNVFKYPTLYTLPIRGHIRAGDSLVISFPVGKPQRGKVIKYQNIDR